ncbi:MAG: polysaccharide biosynthesis protein [Candidatus Yanofskybacteria bacterium CG10_big_fil_rev_8_21_14_0_10_36_16]|uniref:Polysaccharide biosynthesis protein n=1 Tax=Candidatus Yanofskybacteria bacterium CG10_big_fil_rev_8_21_14_0_10_36_16 TaxID=1975096 RepID=A0A2J0QAC2_9BACT|nr:MAG: polysaccharide biosynthesis protein [Candidatus Yanofskybacteria bacterium CG10_big_fil_rev_8_21_14_0_10_36_16]
MKYLIAKPFITNIEKKNIQNVLTSGILSIGPFINKFESKFAEIIGVKYACAVSSGTAGLHLAMIAAEIKSGDEIITSPFSFIASANCILYVNAKPVFVDIDPATYNIDPQKIEEKITKNTKAILVVHIFGQTADMDSIKKIAKKHNLKIIEDACESIGAKYKNKNAGTFGESAVFAFYPNKQITTGEGGMLVTNSKKIYNTCRSLRNQGRAEDMRWLDHKRLGYNYRMDEMSAALGLTQLDKLNFLLREREKIALLYNKYLSKHDDLIILPQMGPNNKHTWFVYVVRLKGYTRVKRDNIMLRLAKIGISTKPYLPSIHLFSFYKKMFGYKKGDYSVSELVSDSSLALPFYIGLKEKDIKIISKKLINILKNG